MTTNRKIVRKRPVEVQAIQLLEGSFEECVEWLGAACNGHNKPNEYIVIRTLEGLMTARYGDWIMRGVAGEFYPCADRIFQKTYDVVGPAE